MSRSEPRKRRPKIAAAAAVAIVLLAGGTWWLLRSRGAWSPGTWKGSSVLIVTVDTLRADRLGAYGCRDIQTPAIDALAARGTLFERAISTTPLTLPSHTTIFSGTYPLRHGVRDNGGFVVPKELPLLAELFRAEGYDTAAFVAAFVLDSRWGLDRGFGVYHDDFDMRKANLVSIGDIERPAGEVVDAALSWLDRQDAARPFFLWVHLFDPHAPYAPPSPYAEPYAGAPYLGEIAYVDGELARLFARLDDRTAVVFAGDHGESLGEHEEDGHGLFVYQPTQRVPLIVAPPVRGEGSAARRPEVVSLADVMPTLVELAGLPPPAGVQGKSLVPLLSGRGAWSERPAYSETLYPLYHFGWSPLASIQDGRWKLIESSDPELYDLELDPGEATNLAKTDRNRYLEVRRRFVSLTEELGRNLLSARTGKEDPEAARKLASLGYLSGGPETRPAAGEALSSPRAKLALYNKLNAARSITARAELPKAERALREVLAEDPGIVDARIALASVVLKSGRYDEAMPYLEESIRQRPSDVTLVISLALAQSRAGRPTDAEATLRRAIDGGLEDSRFSVLLGAIAEGRGDRTKADEWNARALAAEPESASLHSALAETMLNRGDFDAAMREADRALALDPKVLGAHYVRARVLERRGSAAEAFAEYGREIAVNAIDERSFSDLARLSRGPGLALQEASLLEDSIERHPDHPLPYLYLARNLLSRSESLDRAVEAAQAGLSRSSSRREEAFGCFLLADLYNRLGDREQSVEFAKKGRALTEKE